ncbi:MAG: glycosyltransferase [Clostridiales bacterium]|nr:glycosyltransferase [Clostridiales bacterium]
MTMLTANNIIAILFTICYFYQIVYTLASMRRTVDPFPKADPRRYAILICAHNEEAVIGPLIDSILAQKYPQGLVDIFVGADNCDDGTAEIARAHGATVLERSDKTHIGKGYVLHFLIDSITESCTRWDYYGFIIIDADNILDSGFVAAMNDALCSGPRAVTGYRNSKNFGDNWLSASYALWFLHESRIMNGARERFRLNAQILGTGFAVSSDLLRELGGWNYFTLTEDLELTFALTERGERIGYTPYAILYDEQPTRFRVSWHQRMRWIKGYFQSYALYGGAMLRRTILKHSFPCYDMLMSVLAGSMLFVGTIVFYFISLVYTAAISGDVAAVLFHLGRFLAVTYGTLVVIGFITAGVEWPRIYAPRHKILGYTFTFPFFFYTLFPVLLWLPFDRNIWPHIEHTRVFDMEDIRRGKS